MKIKTLLLLVALSSLVTPGVIGSVALFATRQTNRIAAQGTQAELLITGAFELNTFAQSYVAHGDERPRTQWYAQYAELGQMLASPVLQMEPSRSSLPALRADLDDIRRSFDALVTLSGTAEPDSSAELTAGDLLVKTQRLITDADDLAKKASQERLKSRAGTDLLIFFMLATLALAATATTVLLYRRIIGPIVELQRGTAIVGRGDLEFKVDRTGGDEISQLAAAFDGMTAKLKQSYDTLERRVEERTGELREASAKNELLLESIGDGVIAIDRAWRVTLWNASAERITGWRRQEAIGKLFRELVELRFENSKKENVAFIEEAMLYGEVRIITEKTVLIRRDGREIPVGDSAAPIHDEAGVIIGAIIVFRDATPEREAMQLRSDFTYAAHQLRTPVTKAMWSVEEALNEEERPKVRKKIEAAYFDLKSVLRLNEQLLLVSQLDQGLVHPDREHIVLSLFAVDVLKDAAAQARAHNLTIEASRVPPALAIDTDPKLLRRILDELFDNAIAYGAEKKPITFSITEREDGVLLQVRNLGIGIVQEQHPQVFTKFFRGSNFDTTYIVGAGLGLYIAKEYAGLLKGNISFTSVEGKETVFSVFLPMGERDDAATSPRQKKRSDRSRSVMS